MEIDDILRGSSSDSEDTPVRKRGRPKKVVEDIDDVLPKPKKKVSPPIPVARKSASFHDARKLTKKHQESIKEKWSRENAASTRNQMMRGLVESGKEKFGVSKVFASRKELEKLVIGIPTPSIAFEYLIANDVFPLSSFVMIAGQWASCKSALSYEIFRWFYELMGFIVHVDTEHKFDSDFALSIMRAPDESAFIHNQASSVEEMQEMLSHWVAKLREVFAGNKEDAGPGPSVPCVFCIDSLAGATSREVQEKILKEGSASRSHPIAQLKMAQYLPAFKAQLEGYPFSLLVVNHLKEKTDERGFTHQYTLGGQAVNFHESIEIRNKIWKSHISNSQFSGKGILLKCAKNSFGEDGRQIKTRFLWCHERDEETGEDKPVYYWDWNWSTVTLLNDITDSRLKSRLKERGLTIKVKKPSADLECLACFPAVGMSSSDYLPFQEVGQMIQDNEDVCNSLREALDIQRRHILDRPFDEIEKEYMENIE